MIVKGCKSRLTSLAVAWIDYYKAYDKVLYSWIQKWMEVFGVAVNIVNTSMKQWNTELTEGNQRLGNMKINCGISKGNRLSQLLFVLVMISLPLVLRRTKASRDVKKECEKSNHLMFTDDLELYAKNNDQIGSLVNTVRILSEDIEMEFGLSKCETLITKRGKVVKRSS